MDSARGSLAQCSLAAGIGGGSFPALIAAGLALIAGLCSVARLNPAIRNPDAQEVADTTLG